MSENEKDEDDLTKFFSSEDDIYAKAFKIFYIFGIDYRTPIGFGLTAIVDWSAKFVTEIINSYVLGTPTKICQDFTGIFIRTINDIESTQNQWDFNDIKALNNFHDTYIGEIPQYYNNYHNDIHIKLS